MGCLSRFLNSMHNPRHESDLRKIAASSQGQFHAPERDRENRSGPPGDPPAVASLTTVVIAATAGGIARNPCKTREYDEGPGRKIDRDPGRFSQVPVREIRRADAIRRPRTTSPSSRGPPTKKAARRSGGSIGASSNRGIRSGFGLDLRIRPEFVETRPGFEPLFPQPASLVDLAGIRLDHRRDLWGTFVRRIGLEVAHRRRWPASLASPLFPGGAAHPRVAGPDGLGPPHLADCAWTALRICSLTASRLKLAPFCIGGNSMNVSATFATSCCANVKRQNSWAKKL